MNSKKKSSTRKKKKNSIRGHSSKARLEFEIWRKNERLYFKGSLPKENVDLVSEPTSWLNIWDNEKWELKAARSKLKHNTGELIFMLISKRNRKRRFRLYHDDFMSNDLKGIVRAIRTTFYNAKKKAPKIVF